MPYDLPTILFNDTDRTLQLAIKDASGAPLVITGWTLELRIGDSATTPKLTKALTVTAGAAGECEATLTPAELTALGSGKLRYSLRRTDAGNKRVVQHGIIPVEVVL